MDPGRPIPAGLLADSSRTLCDVIVFTEVDMAVIAVHALPGLYEEVMVPKLREFREFLPETCGFADCAVSLAID